MKVQLRQVHRYGKCRLPALVQSPAPFEICGQIAELLQRIRRGTANGSIQGNLRELFTAIGRGLVLGGAFGLVGIRPQRKNGVILLFRLRALT